MSMYSEVTTSIKDVACLVKGLVKMGFKESAIEINEEKSVALRGYSGDTRKQRAHIRIKGAGWKEENAVGRASNDLGWERQADGTFAMHVSDYDSEKYGEKWQNKLEAQYSSEVIQQEARLHGWQLGEVKEETSGQITIKCHAAF